MVVINDFESTACKDHQESCVPFDNLKNRWEPPGLVIVSRWAGNGRKACKVDG
jgi:hypothetical protein